MSIKLPPNRWEGAACVAAVSDLLSDPDFAYPQGSGKTRNQKARNFIYNFCSECPIMRQCRDYAFANDETVGVWGGLTEEERLSMSRIRLRLG